MLFFFSHTGITEMQKKLLILNTITATVSLIVKWASCDKCTEEGRLGVFFPTILFVDSLWCMIHQLNSWDT